MPLYFAACSFPLFRMIFSIRCSGSLGLHRIEWILGLFSIMLRQHSSNFFTVFWNSSLAFNLTYASYILANLSHSKPDFLKVSWIWYLSRKDFLLRAYADFSNVKMTPLYYVLYERHSRLALKLTFAVFYFTLNIKNFQSHF